MLGILIFLGCFLFVVVGAVLLMQADKELAATEKKENKDDEYILFISDQKVDNGLNQLKKFNTESIPKSNFRMSIDSYHSDLTKIMVLIIFLFAGMVYLKHYIKDPMNNSGIIFKSVSRFMNKFDKKEYKQYRGVYDDILQPAVGKSVVGLMENSLSGEQPDTEGVFQGVVDEVMNKSSLPCKNEFMDLCVD